MARCTRRTCFEQRTEDEKVAGELQNIHGGCQMVSGFLVTSRAVCHIRRWRTSALSERARRQRHGYPARACMRRAAAFQARQRPRSSLLPLLITQARQRFETSTILDRSINQSALGCWIHPPGFPTSTRWTPCTPACTPCKWPCHPVRCAHCALGCRSDRRGSVHGQQRPCRTTAHQRTINRAACPCPAAAFAERRGADKSRGVSPPRRTSRRIPTAHITPGRQSSAMTPPQRRAARQLTGLSGKSAVSASEGDIHHLSGRGGRVVSYLRVGEIGWCEQCSSILCC